jgi:undecaprenyl pyrophosphate synthase
MFGILGNPWVGLALALFLLTSHGMAYYKGHESATDKAKLVLLKETQAKVEAMNAYDKVSRELVKAYQEKEVVTKTVYKAIKEKVKDETTGRVCLNDGAVSVWDSALKGVLPEASTRVAKEASRTYSDEEVLTNAVENFEQYNSCREQLNALIDWHENN